MKLKTLVFVAAAVFFGSAVIAQNADSKWGFGGQVGFMQYSGDYSTSFYVPSSGVAPGLIIARYLNPSLDILIEANFIRMQGDDHGERGRDVNLHFDATMMNANLLLKYKFDNGYILETTSRLGPYLIVGIGVLNSNSEGFGYAKHSATPFTAKVTALNPCGGAGLTYKLSAKLSLFLQSCLWLTQNDEIDGWAVDSESDQKNDAFLKTSVGVVFNLGKGSGE